jgi:hypothetical protein
MMPSCCYLLRDDSVARAWRLPLIRQSRFIHRVSDSERARFSSDRDAFPQRMNLRLG